MEDPQALQVQTAHRPAPGDRYCLTPHKLKPGHRLSVLVDGAEAYPAMLAAILGARREVLLETYIFEGDATGKRFHHALCERAMSGVSVRLVVDGAGSWNLSGNDREELLEAGAHLATFHPVRPWRRRWGWSVRDHRKLLVVDEEVAFTGGINIGDEYAPRDWGGKGWHDVHVRVHGPVVADLRRYFFDSWRYASPDGVPRRLTHPRPARAHGPEPSESARRADVVPGQAEAGGRVQALAIGRFRDRRSIEKHLQRAVSLSASLLRGRVRIFEYLPTMLHAKSIVVDGAWCSIGSYNLDQRSLQYNWELVLSIVDDEAAFALEERFARDLPLCREIDPAEWRRRPWWQRVNEQIFYYFRLWL